MEKQKGSCHCGAVKFEAKGNFKEVMSCNCSICQRKGSLLAFVADADFTLLSGADHLVDYQWGKKRIHHTFCNQCGVSAFSSATNPQGEKMKAVNVRCLDGVDVKSLRVKEFDGKSL